jgi:predicted outer membrane repeat protein
LNALDTGSDITGNCSTTDGGGAYVNGGTLYLSNADVHANQALGATGRGGAIFASGDAVITMTTSSFIGESAPCCNTAYDGGGICQSLAFLVGGQRLSCRIRPPTTAAACICSTQC